MKTLYTIVAVLIISSCADHRHDENKINIAEAMNHPIEKLVLQDLFSGIDYIPLETNDSSLVGEQSAITVLDSFILISSINQHLKLFDRTTGRYIRDIGHIGIDPQGYAKDDWGKMNFWTDHSQKTVYVSGWNNDFLLYDLQGNYKDKIQLQEDTHGYLAQTYFLMDADRIWGHNKLKLSHETPSLFYIDKETLSMVTLATWESTFLPENEIQSISTLQGGYVPFGGDLTMADIAGDKKFYTAINSPSLWEFDNTVKLKQAFNDTIYTVTENGITPYKVFDLGKWHWDEENLLNVDGNNKKIAIDYVLENSNYIYFHFRIDLFNIRNSQSYCGFYNKKTENVSVIKGDRLLDKENNQSVQIRGVSSDGSFIALLLPDDLSDDNLRRLKIEEDNNPIIVILR